MPDGRRERVRSEFFRSKGTYVMAPMVDSINHVSTLPTEVEFDSLRQRFKIKVNKAFQKGEQVGQTGGTHESVQGRKEGGGSEQA